MYTTNLVKASCLALCGIGLCVYVGIQGYKATFAPTLSSGDENALTSTEDVSPPAEPVLAFIDCDEELPRPAVLSGLSDSDLEYEAQRPVQRVVQVDKGDTLMHVLLRSGVESADANRVIEALSDVYNPRHLRAGQEIVVSFNRPRSGIGWGQFAGISLRTDPVKTVLATRTEDAKFDVREQTLEATSQTLRVEGVIQSSLFQSGQEQGVPAQILVEMIRALSYDVDFQRDIQPGYTYEAVYERQIDKKGNQVQGGGALLYTSLTMRGDPIAFYRFTDSTGNTDYYTAKGENVRKALLRTPVDGARISSGFGRRKHPILGYTKAHKGVDFAVPTGTPIMAAGDGTAVRAGWNGGYGNYVRLQHNKEYATAYAHMSRIAVKQGAKVKQGQIIGYVGSTGQSTGPHLHYEILVNGTHVNPLGVKFKSGTTLAGKELESFRKTVAEIDKLRKSLPSNGAPSARLASLRVGQASQP